ncbi:phosphate signaling complex protein PhoU [Salirhabdus salicampi]|uniref:phosphate signaling complex protein PhoU n=1 Tax=Salirhabdus salicampi TaxID=476102 RepID=UPI0020C3E038|nr:phosphate signaling complex protein PhoU [Salirhabdus salicampi]MCP8616868.1 phosphate signaling complex protein PhoU [Salirhabdus salicampi]
MSVREHFQDDLEGLKELIKDLAKDVRQRLDEAVYTLYHKDVEGAQKIIDDDKELDQKELIINEKAILLITKEQPFATDLRRLIIALKISSDLERMADHAVNIAKSTLRLGEAHSLTIHPNIDKMCAKAIDMVTLAIQAFEQEDITLAKKLADLDDEIDAMHSQVIRDMLQHTESNPEVIQHIMQMAFSSRYIERFADHITNIGENVFYLVKGETYDLNK